MSLMACKECKAQISDKAEKCPQCGAKVKKPTSLIKVFIVGALLIWVARSVLDPAAGISVPNNMAQSDDCNASNFSVTVARTFSESGFTHIVGTAKNGNQIPCGIEVKYSTYDKNGGVLRSNDAWPASIRNIGSGQTENFDFMLPYEKIADKADVVPLRAKHWN